MSDASDRILAALAALDPLGDLPRTGWIIRGIAPAETLAAHTLQVALIVAMLVDELRAAGVTVDGERALRMALVHDAAEARTGDVPMPHKTPAFAAALHEVEARLVAEMLPAPLVRDWEAAEGGTDADAPVEARLVAAADKLQMLAKLERMARAGRAVGPAFEGMWQNPSNLRGLELAPVRALYQAIFARAGRPMPVVAT